MIFEFVNNGKEIWIHSVKPISPHKGTDLQKLVTGQDVTSSRYISDILKTQHKLHFLILKTSFKSLEILNKNIQRRII